MKCVLALAVAANLLVAFSGATEESVEARPSDACMCAQNIDFVGGDLTSVRGGRDSCCAECKRHLDCAAYSWTNYQGGTCWLKTRSGEAKVYIGATGCVITKDPTVESYATIFNCDWPGNDLYQTKATADNFRTCQSFCWGVRGCKAVTWTNYQGGTCWYKGAVKECKNYPGAKSSAMLTFTN